MANNYQINLNDNKNCQINTESLDVLESVTGASEQNTSLYAGFMIEILSLVKWETEWLSLPRRQFVI